jgi:hypothetical protein
MLYKSVPKCTIVKGSREINADLGTRKLYVISHTRNSSIKETSDDARIDKNYSFDLKDEDPP